MLEENSQNKTSTNAVRSFWFIWRHLLKFETRTSPNSHCDKFFLMNVIINAHSLAVYVAASQIVVYAI